MGFFREEWRKPIQAFDAAAALQATLPQGFMRWPALARDQYVEANTLMSGYLLSSQGDRMLMANSVEGRFPFLDRHVGALAESLPPSYKLKVLDEKHVLKRAAAGIVPAAILGRSKQPYRAPDALSFATPEASEWVEEVASARALKAAGIFAPEAGARLIEKCRARAGQGQFSNSDNMGVVGMLSTQLVHHQFIAHRPRSEAPAAIRTLVDRVAAPAGRR
jgi:asparagine synthase (glutamine-hydrolysing)